MALYWPQMAATIFVPSAGLPAERQAQEITDDVFRFDIRPTSARLVSNPYNEADEIELRCTYDELGLDPRFIRSAEVYFYADDGYAFGGFTPGASNLRFLGIARHPERAFDDNAKSVTITFQDYTCLFLEATSFPSSGVPSLTDTLTTAWQKICDHTGYWDLDTREVQSTVRNLRDKLTILGDIDPFRTLGSAFPSRLARLGKIQVGSAADAWAVWQACVGSLGLMSWIRGDRCFVANATDYYTASDPPRFVYGLNIKTISEGRDVGQLSSKNVCVRAYDPIEGKTLESLYPPLELAQRKKRLGASTPKHPPKVIHSQDYENMDWPYPVADQATLDDIARRAWEERTRQELSGRLTTGEMSVDTVNGSERFDLLGLAAGDQIQVEIESSALDLVQRLPTVGKRVAELTGRGYAPSVATYIARNLDSIGRLPSQFLVHRVSTEIESSTPEGGCSYSMEIEYINRIDITAGGTVPIGAGAASNQAMGRNQPPVGGQGTRAKGKPPS